MSTALDIDALRAETPGCTTGIHFNHAGASLPSRQTLAAVIDHLQREALSGPMEAAASVADLIAEARGDAAALIGATPEEIAFTTSGSAGWGMAFAALPPLASGDRVLVGRQEWGGNLATLRAAADRVGAEIEIIPVKEDGSADAAALANMIDRRVRLISLTWLPANGGLINDAAAIGKVARKAGIPYVIDAGQALGQLPVDVEAIGCDVLKGAGRKYLRGPRGTAILYVRRAFLEKLQPPFLDVLAAPWVDDGPRIRTDAQRFETSEASIALRLGLGAALKQARSLGISQIRNRIATLSERLRGELIRVPGIAVHDLGTERSGLVSFTLRGMSASTLRAKLAEKRITIGANGVPYTPLDMKARGLNEIARASVSYLNTDAEIDRLCETVSEIAAGWTRT
jgi:selenocysteine lyase/cysteine desulfurase